MIILLLSVSALGGYRFESWTTDDGLPQNGVREITQTPDGYLWFTTFDGLVRFDGVRFAVFNKGNTDGILNNRFTSIHAGKDGTVYAATTEDGVLTIYRNGEFTTIPADQVPGHYIQKIKDGPDGRVRFLSEDEDRKSKSWYNLVDGQFVFVERPEPYYENFVVSGHGAEWLVTRSGVTQRTGGEANTFIPFDTTRLSFRPNSFVDSKGRLWLGANSVSVFEKGSVRTFGEEIGLLSNTVYYGFWEEADGSIWFASGGASSSGVGMVRFKDGSIKIYGTEHGLANTSVFNLFRDREGITWLATNRGLKRMRPQIVEGFSTNDGLDHPEVYPLYRRRNGEIWIGSTRGLSVYRDGKFAPLEIEPAPLGTPLEDSWRPGRMSVQSLHEDRSGTMWIGLNGGIFLIDGLSPKVLIKGYHVQAIKSDKNGSVWAATNKGLLKFDDYKLTATYSTGQGLPNEAMTYIHEDRNGVLWFGGYGGISRFENGRFLNYTKKNGLAGNYVRSIYEDAEGTFWIGTYDEGMSRFRDGRFVNYREEDGLFSSGVFAIEEDAAGYFWISSNRGIYRVRKQELNEFAEGGVTRINSVGYGKADGMLSNECNGGRQPASLRDELGRFWFPTQEGVAIVDPAAERPNPLPPTAVIEDVLADRQTLGTTGTLAIEPGKRDLEIRYTGISLIHSEQIKFQYKLDGHDPDWIDAGTRRSAFYSYLPPGDYTFRVRAANSDGVWSTADGQLAFELQPFFYQTSLFYLLLALTFAAILFFTWRISVHQLKLRERKLTHLVAERTAELATANENLIALANSDGLTKIGNRRRFEAFLADEWHRAVRFKTEISLVLFDIDHFKLFNDTYGHQAGDECLQQVAEAFAATIKRPTDLVARFGGEEFAMVLGGTPVLGALQLAEEALANVKQMKIRHSESPTSEFLTVSVGIATILPDLSDSENDLIRLADSALYHAKRQGRDRIYVYDQTERGPLTDDILAREILIPRPSSPSGSDISVC